jgi:hypothetical protein
MEWLSVESISFRVHGFKSEVSWLWAVLEHKEKLSWLESSSSWVVLEAKRDPGICLDWEWWSM